VPSAGKFTLGSATDSLELIQAQGTHNSHLTRLAQADQDQAMARLAAWTGVQPMVPGAREMPQLKTPRMPPAFVRGLRALRHSP
jgi:outer membrane protein TolC